MAARFLKAGLFTLLALTGCDLEQNVDIALPAHIPQLVVECYLEPGQPYQLTLTESASYFESPEPPQVPEAIVVITYQGQPDTLVYAPFVDKTRRRLYTHSSPTRVSGQPGAVYTLEITDQQGRTLSGTTTLMAPVLIDSLVYKFNDRHYAYIEARFTDQGATDDFYFFSVHRDSTNGRGEVNYFLPDRLNNGQPISFGTGYEFNPYDSLIVSLFHLEKQYFDFLTSVEEARNANSNPFAPPSRLYSTVQGGLGVFTNLAVDRKGTVLKK